MPNSESIETKPLHRRLRDARRAQGITQSALAARAGCKQSALSMLESGREDALAQTTVARIAELLGVDLTAGTASAVAEFSTGTPLCPNGGCPSNVPYLVDGEVLFWPGRQPSPGGRHCAYCGEVLERNCPACGAAALPGACCSQCGSPYVPVSVPTGGAAEWAATRRREISEWRSLVDPLSLQEGEK